MATQTGTDSAPKKRSLFNKPAWSKPQALANGNDLFHRSNQTYVEAAAEAERQRKRRLARKEIERCRQGGSEERAGKRQRISSDEEDDDGGSSSDDDPSHTKDKNGSPNLTKNARENLPPPMSTQRSRNSPKSLLERYEAAIGAQVLDIEQKLKARPSTVINVDGYRDPQKSAREEYESDVAIVNASKPFEENDQTASDEEFPELARRAREKARRKRLEEDIAAALDPPPSGGSDGYMHRSQSTHPSTPPPPPPDPVLKLLITSHIPNTEPLIVNRRLSQRLKEVKDIWTQRQQLTPEIAETIFLVWRGKKCFNVTSCKSLGIIVDSNGNIRTNRDSLEDLNGQIHLEAMTEEIFEAYRKAKRHEVTSEEEKQAEEPVGIEEEKVPEIRIILKAKGFADFKLKVKSSTLISKMINAFRSTNHIGDEKEVYLMFDGDKLSPESQVGDTELSDMDTLDVIIK
ncbi:hypothetical protein N7G274_001501 [Stereocaulon virgatum]|uniref:Rad60/SUMO-like domain-containing protein n=1 Tax=Stereocaulon virgatum TaxID=373712 RepID=A0ABR4AMZ4_9LECA